MSSHATASSQRRTRRTVWSLLAVVFATLIALVALPALASASTSTAVPSAAASGPGLLPLIALALLCASAGFALRFRQRSH